MKLLKGVLLLAALSVVSVNVVAFSSGLLRASPTETSDDFMANWMGKLSPVLGDLTLLDISVPITHDTLTYDLDTTVSNGAWDGHPTISKLLHLFHWIAPGGWIRDEARTQGLDVVGQLNNGVRFLDFRMMKDGSNAEHDWYTLHFVQGKTKAEEYMKAIRKWVDEHPTEVIYFYTSRHGGVCEKGDEAFPGVSDSDKQKYWKVIKSIFDGVMFDPRDSQLNKTSLKELVSKNQRVVMAIGSFDEFTGNDPFAIDACALRGNRPYSTPAVLATVDEAAATVANVQLVSDPAASYYRNKYNKWMPEFDAEQSIVANKAKNVFTSEWVEGDPPTDDQMVQAFYLAHVPFFKDSHKKKCIGYYGIKGMDWCPPGLLDNSQLQNYYLQFALEEAHQKQLTLPSIAVNVLDQDGTIRTDVQPFTPGSATLSNGYAFVDTLLASNVRYACKNVSAGKPECDTLAKMIEDRRAKYPLRKVDDATHGRLTDIPSP
eukprot:GFYU01001233.1.p1 GENE.GFYU01001233.1~~GFYU01001233.1.p1  ORF type:complete len:487 (-),score=162.24 GFYU01001233.1:119-1579(-)